MERALFCLALALPLGLSDCASTSHVTAFQEAVIAPPPRTLGLALDRGETLPFGLAATAVADAVAKAGFDMTAENPRYLLILTAAAESTDAGSYLPPAEIKNAPNWVARPDRSLRARIAGGHILRVTAVLIDAAANREVWRGTGTLRTDNPAAAAKALTGEVLAKLPH